MTAPTDGSVLAIDIGGTKIAIARVANGAVSGRRQIATPRTGRGADLVAAIADHLGDAGDDPIAVATTGIVRDGRLTALNPQTLPIENEFPLAGAIEAATGRRPLLVNDAQAAAWGEYRHGAGRGCANFAFVTVSTGIGAGIVADGRLLVGRNGLAGHLGHAVVDPAGEPCGCGRRGCLEAVASGSAIACRASQRLARPLSAPEVFALAAAGNEAAEALIVAAAESLAAALADLAAIYDVERVALGGGVGLAPGFLERVRAATQKLPAAFRRDLRPATAGADAGLLGAAALVLEGNLLS